MSNKIYRVVLPGQQPVLVRAKTRAGAIAHALSDYHVTAKAASQDDLLGVDPASVQTAPSKVRGEASE